MAQYTNALKACPVIIWPDGSWTFLGDPNVCWRETGIL